MLGIYVSKEAERRLANIAKKTHRSKSFYVRQALDMHLDYLEMRYGSEDGNMPSGSEAMQHLIAALQEKQNTASK